VTDDIVIVGYAELKNELKSNRSVYELAGEVLSKIITSTNLEKDAIDGFCAASSLTEGNHLFYGAQLTELLSLSLNWFMTTSTGGTAILSGVAAAASALREGRCEVALVLGVDAPSTENRLRMGAYWDGFQSPTGVLRPPAQFGLLMRAYQLDYHLDLRALGKIAVTQRTGALANDNALTRLRRPLTLDEYLDSRYVADPLRLLDSVMFCDGGNAVMLTTERHAGTLGLKKMARFAGYAERTGHLAAQAMPDVLETGFSVAGPKAMAQAGLTLDRVSMLQCYDDFTIAVLMQLEELGFCERGGGSDYISSHDFSPAGDLPLNTGGGQLSAGQPGLAGGGLVLVEAVRQLFGEAGSRQIVAPANALVTGIGAIPHARNWLMSSVMVLEA
jgi:acetyl-CoA acetyltransferase